MFKKNNELSSALEQEFRPDIITQLGFSGALTALAFDPVQRLFAIGTETGLIQVLGAGEIRAVLDPNPKHKAASAPILHLRFVTSVYLVAIDDRSLITVWALDEKKLWASYQCPLSVGVCFTDPAMDWLWMGHTNGETTVFDIDRGFPTAFHISNLERLVNPKFSSGSVLNVQMHPRDPSLLLLVYREVAVCWNLAKGEIAFDLHYEFPLYYAVWHPSGSHIVSSHVNGLLVFWDGQRGVRLGARVAFPPGEGQPGISDSHRLPEKLYWCCHEDPTNTFLVVSGGRSLRVFEFGPTPTVATSSYDSMGNFYKNPQIQQHEQSLPGEIRQVVVLPQAGVPHYLGGYNPQHAVVLAGNEIYVLALPTLYRLQQDAVVLPSALAWRSHPITSLQTVGIPRNQWIGMMAAAPPNLTCAGGSSATQQIRKLQLATVMVVGYADGSVRLFDGTRMDSRDYRVICISTSGLSEQPASPVQRVSVGAEVGELSIANASGEVYMATFGKNRRPTQPGPPTPCPEITNIEHLVSQEYSQGFIPRYVFKPSTSCGCTTALCNSNIGFVAFGYENGRLCVVDKRGPALILDTKLHGTATAIDFGILQLGTDAFSSILLSVGTSRGDVYVYRVMPRPMGGYQVLSESQQVLSLGVGKEPVRYLAHINTSQGCPARAQPDMMAKLPTGVVVPGAILASTYSNARFFQLSGPKTGKRLGSKSFDTPLASFTYAYLRAGAGSSSFVTVNPKGKLGIYGLPGFGTLCTYALPFPPMGQGVTISEMGDAFVPYDPHTNAGQIVRVFGTNQCPNEDDVYSVKRKVPARPQISTAHWIAGRQFYKVSDIDAIIGGKRRAKSRRLRSQLVDETATTEPSQQKAQQVKSKALPNFVHPQQHHGFSHKKTWGQSFNEYYESAENTVNEALDEAMGRVSDGKKSAQSSAIKGVIGSKLGF